MKVETKRDAVKLLESVQFALNHLTVQGKDNCYIVVACNSDIDAVMDFLVMSEAPETLEEQESED